YLGEPTAENKYRAFLTADGFSTHVKLAGVVETDPQTGQLTIVFNELPESPFQEFSVHLFGSERGLFAMPSKCGEYEVSATFVPWDSALVDQSSVSKFKVDEGPDGKPCAAGKLPFGPQLVAGGPDNTAGVFNPIALQITRDDGDQNLRNLQVKTPPGLL